MLVFYGVHFDVSHVLCDTGKWQVPRPCPRQAGWLLSYHGFMVSTCVFVGRVVVHSNDLLNKTVSLLFCVMDVKVLVRFEECEMPASGEPHKRSN